jgi:hypothetical protein
VPLHRSTVILLYVALYVLLAAGESFTGAVPEGWAAVITAVLALDLGLALVPRLRRVRLVRRVA